MKKDKNLKEKIIIGAVAVIILVAVVLLVVINDKNNGSGNGNQTNAGANGNNGGNNSTNNGTANGDGHYYDELFSKDIMDIRITMSEDDVFLMRETPSEDNNYYSDVIINGISWTNVAIRVRGKKNTEEVFESGSDKYSYKLDFNEFDKKNEFYELDGMYLHNMIEDPSYIGQYISYKLMEKLGATVPYYALAKVQINDEAAEWYFVTEEYNNSFAKRVTGDDGTVCLFEPANEDAILSSADSVVNYEIKYGEDGAESYIDRLIEVLNDPDSTEADIEAVLDVESALKAFAVNYVVGNYAGYQGADPDNFYLLYDNGIITYIEEDFVGAGGNYRKDKGYSITVEKTSPLYDTADEERPLVTVLLGRGKYYKMYEEYISQLADYINSEDVLSQAKELLGDYVTTSEYAEGEERLLKYLDRFK